MSYACLTCLRVYRLHTCLAIAVVALVVPQKATTAIEAMAVEMITAVQIAIAIATSAVIETAKETVVVGAIGYIIEQKELS